MFASETLTNQAMKQYGVDLGSSEEDKSSNKIDWDNLDFSPDVDNEVKKPSKFLNWDNLNFDLNTPVPEPLEVIKPESSVYEGLIKPTAKALVKVPASVASSMALLPGAGIASLAKLMPRISTDPNKGMEMGSLDEAMETFNQVMAIPSKFITTPEEQEAVENISLAMKPIEMSGEGWRLIGEQINNGLRVLGLPEDTYLEPLLGTYGEAAAIFAMPKLVNKVGASNWFRSLAVRERGLVVQSLAEAMKKNPNMTEGQLLRTYDNPMWRTEALSKRNIVESYSEVKKWAEQKTGEAIVENVIKTKKKSPPKPKAEMRPAEVDPDYTFTSQKGNYFEKIGDKWFDQKGKEVTNRFVIEAAERKKVEFGVDEDAASDQLITELEARYKKDIDSISDKEIEDYIIEKETTPKQPKLRYEGEQEGLGSLYTIMEGPERGSTLSAKTLNERGIKAEERGRVIDTSDMSPEELRIFETLSKVEKEPTTDLDLQTGIPEPDTMPDTFRQSDKELTKQQLKTLPTYERIDNVDSLIARMETEVNAWLDGEGVDIASTKRLIEQLSDESKKWAEGVESPPGIFEDMTLAELENFSEYMGQLYSWTRRAKREVSKTLDIRDKHDRYRAIESMINTSGGSTPVPVIESHRHLFTPEEINRLFDYFENNPIMDKRPTTEQVTKEAEISDLVDYSKREVGVKRPGGDGTKLYSGIPVDKIFSAIKDLGKAFKVRKLLNKDLMERADRLAMINSFSDMLKHDSGMRNTSYDNIRKLNNVYVIVSDNGKYIPGDTTIGETLKAINHPDFDHFSIKFDKLKSTDLIGKLEDEYKSGYIDKKTYDIGKRFLSYEVGTKLYDIGGAVGEGIKQLYNALIKEVRKKDLRSEDDIVSTALDISDKTFTESSKINKFKYSISSYVRDTKELTPGYIAEQGESLSKAIEISGRQIEKIFNKSNIHNKAISKMVDEIKHAANESPTRYKEALDNLYNSIPDRLTGVSRDIVIKDIKSKTVSEISLYDIGGATAEGIKQIFDKLTGRNKTKVNSKPPDPFEGVKEEARELVFKRAGGLGVATYDTNKFINSIEQRTTKSQREVMPFVIEKTDIPDELGRLDLQEVIKRDKKYLEPIAEEVKAHFDQGFKKVKAHLKDLTVKQIDDYVTHLWDIPKHKKAEAIHWFQTQDRFMERRFIPTYEEGIKKGFKPKTLDISEIIKVHDNIGNRAVENTKYLNALLAMEKNGIKLINRSDEAPLDWIEVDYPALTRRIPLKKTQIKRKGEFVKEVKVRVHPDLVRPLKAVFEERFDHPVISAYEALNGIMKKSMLTLSLFHHGALGETGIALIGPKKTVEIMFNPVKIYQSIVKGDYEIFKKEAIARDGIEHLLQLGATADIPVGRIQKYLEELTRVTQDVPIVNKITKFLEGTNSVWDKALWSYLHDTLKLYGYEILVGKLDPNMSSEMTRKAKIEIAQLVNDTFGGQNWDTLMITPKEIQMMTWSLLSSDWTISTTRQALAPTGIGKVYKETRWLRSKVGRNFWLKAALYFGIGMNMLNALFRDKDIKENPQYYGDKEYSFLDKTMFGNTVGKKTYLFRGRYEDGSERYIRWGKQFRDFFELLISPIQKLGGKVAPVPQLISEMFTGHTMSGFKNDNIYGTEGFKKGLGIIKTAGESFLPISVRRFLDEDIETKPLDIMMQSSKGMSRYNAMEYFKKAIVTGDEEMFRDVYVGALRNNLPAYILFTDALGWAEGEIMSEITKDIDDIRDAEIRLAAATSAYDKNRWGRIVARLKKEKADKESGLTSLKSALEIANSYKERAIDKSELHREYR